MYLQIQLLYLAVKWLTNMCAHNRVLLPSKSPFFFHVNMDLVNFPVVLVLPRFVFIIAIVKSS